MAFHLSFIVIASLAAADPVAVVKDVRLGVHPDKTRLVVELDKKVDFDIFTLAKPNRLVIDLPELTFEATPPKSTKRGVITNLRFGLFEPGRSRVVVDLAKPAKAAKSFFIPPSSGENTRLVVDLVPVDEKTFTAALRTPKRQPAPPAPSNILEVPKPRKKPATAKKVVVIDPGHGGVDPGAIGPAAISRNTSRSVSRDS